MGGAKQQTRESAANELAKFSQERKAEMTKRVEVNRAQEKEMEAGRLAAMKPDANPWERVVDLIDTSARTADEARDTSRMRSLLIQLKSNPVVTSVAWAARLGGRTHGKPCAESDNSHACPGHSLANVDSRQSCSELLQGGRRPGSAMARPCQQTLGH